MQKTNASKQSVIYFVKRCTALREMELKWQSPRQYCYCLVSLSASGELWFKLDVHCSLRSLVTAALARGSPSPPLRVAGACSSLHQVTTLQPCSTSGSSCLPCSFSARQLCCCYWNSAAAAHGYKYDHSLQVFLKCSFLAPHFAFLACFFSFFPSSSFPSLPLTYFTPYDGTDSTEQDRPYNHGK